MAIRSDILLMLIRFKHELVVDMKIFMFHTSKSLVTHIKESEPLFVTNLFARINDEILIHEY